MLLGSSRNGRLEVTQFSVPTTSGTVSVIQRDAKSNMIILTITRIIIILRKINLLYKIIKAYLVQSK